MQVTKTCYEEIYNGVYHPCTKNKQENGISHYNMTNGALGNVEACKFLTHAT